MSKAQTHQGGCHCGAVRYEVELSLDSVISCNCSICSKRGHWLAFAPASHFHLLSGENEALAEYRFNSHRIGHTFCRTCGIGAFGRGAMPDGTPTVAINVRCLDGIDLDAIQPVAYDGRSR